MPERATVMSRSEKSAADGRGEAPKGRSGSEGGAAAHGDERSGNGDLMERIVARDNLLDALPSPLSRFGQSQYLWSTVSKIVRLTQGLLSTDNMNKPSASASAKPIKDPQPSVDRIDDLAKRILTGDIYLPKFQREFVWERQQVLDLLDSVARNYPIGSILLWQSKQELRSESRIADLEIALPKNLSVNYIHL